ncbi:MAG: hypothetical protein Q4E06_04470 [Lautropia sp.]|nr:hypothetical protein [Lautropia sp.]
MRLDGLSVGQWWQNVVSPACDCGAIRPDPGHDPWHERYERHAVVRGARGQAIFNQQEFKQDAG